MWCVNCQSDVAAEVASDNRRIRCASCGAEIPAAKTLRSMSKTHEARDLLERWSSERLLDPYGPLPGVHSETSAGNGARQQPTETPNPVVAGSSSASSTKPTFRIDRPHSMRGSAETTTPLTQSAVVDLPQSHNVESSAIVTPHEPTIPSGPPGTRIEMAHNLTVRKPHFDVRLAIAANEERRKTNWAAVSGQLLAYLGVLGLTVGTSMVLLGHFRGPESQTATGWLITTAGQMLLFLGVVTLVSGGMEQTTDEVARRIDQLGEKILHLERATSTPTQQAIEPRPNAETPAAAGTAQPATNAK